MKEADRLVSSLQKDVSDEIEDRLGASFRTSVPALIAGLSSKDVGVRTGCVRILGQIGSPACGDALLKALKDQNAGIRAETIAQLCAWIKHEPAAPHVVALFTDPDEYVRYQAIWYAGWLETSRLPLESALRSDNEMMRAGAIRAISHNPGDSWDKATREAWYIRSLRDPSPLVRAAACDSLYFDTSLSILPDVLNAARDEDPRVRTASAEALRGATEDELKEPAFAALVSLLEDPEPGVRKAALGAIEDHHRNGKELDSSVIKKIAGSLGPDLPSDLIVTALYTAGSVRATDLAETCRRLMASDDVKISLAAAVAFYDLDEGVAARSATLALLRDILLNCPDEDVRSDASFRIGFLRSPECEELLCKSMLSDNSPDVRETSGNMLGGRLTAVVTEALLRAVQDYNGAGHTAAWSLVGDREERAFEPILRATRHAESRHRFWAARCLAVLDFKRAVPRLIELMRDPSPSVRLQVASTFKYDHDTRALPELERLAKTDWSRFVREASAEAVAAHGTN